MAYPEGTHPHGSLLLSDHIKICEKHPLRAAEATIKKLRSALIGLVGSENKQELEQMVATLRLFDVAQEDKAVTINAIHALLETAQDQ